MGDAQTLEAFLLDSMTYATVRANSIRRRLPSEVCVSNKQRNTGCDVLSSVRADLTSCICFETTRR